MATYLYNAQEQLVSRTVTQPTASTTHYIYDTDGHLIAEATGTSASTAVITREYIWLEGMPIAVIDGVNTASPVTSYVHTDHLTRPIRLTNVTKATVWQAQWLPHGAAHAITGSATHNLRFPGQYFLIEQGLAYNWHRFYDPTTGRYTQPDPLGFPDGPSRYAYALNSPLMYTDPTGLELPGGARNHNCPNNWSNFFLGWRAHQTFYSIIINQSSRKGVSFDNSFGGEFYGRPDSYSPRGNRGEIWELKSTMYGSGPLYSSAYTQLGGYVLSGNTYRFGKLWSTPYWTRGSWNSLFKSPSVYGIDWLTGQTFKFEPDNPQSSGLIFYSCPQECPANSMSSPLPSLP